MTLSPAFEKRIKRQVTARQHEFFAVTTPGLERLCAEELTHLAPPPATIEAVTGGVAFSGKLTTLYQANLHLRTATRILMRLTEFNATRFDQIHHKLKSFPWELYLFKDQPVEIRVSARHSRLYHRGAISQRVARSVREGLRDQGQTGIMPPVAQRLHLRLEDDRATLSLDSSGEPLFKRGYKTQGVRAPLRETLAAAILLWAGYRPERPLVDPLCGGGTFSIEAALMALGIPPGLRRNFAFAGWPAFRPRHWRHLCRAERSHAPPPTNRPQIFASDREAAVCQALRSEVARTGLNATVTIKCRDALALTPADLPGPQAVTKGLVVLNPPYGVRLGKGKEARRLIMAMGRHLRAHWQGWRVAAVLPEQDLVPHFGHPISLRPLHHGGLHLTLVIGDIS
jgi:putative N6-adenine-specific DNA methylase